MRTIVLTCGLFCLGGLSSLTAQSYEVVYLMEIALSPMQRQYFAESNGLAFALKQAAQFENTDYLYRLMCNADSSAFAYEGRAASTDLSSPYMYGTHKEYFVDRTAVNVTHFNDHYEHYRVEPLMTRGAWTIYADTTDELLGYRVVRATSVEKPHLRVWFAPGLPVPSGPHGLGGLPGLILGMEDSKGSTTTFATSVRILPVQLSAIPWPQLGQQLDLKTYSTYVKNNYGKLRS